MNVLILGIPGDEHESHLADALAQMGATVAYLDTRLFPTRLRMSWRPDTQLGRFTLLNEFNLDFRDIDSVFWRNLSEVRIPSLKDENQQRIAFNDTSTTLRSLIQACPARWINSWRAYQFHKEKPLQLSKAKQLGVKIPNTLISNDPEQVLEFIQSQDKVIFKPVYGGAPTQFVTDSHLEPQRLNLALSISPVTVQEYIPGTNIRSYVIGGSVYAAEIRSQCLDFRQDSEAEIIPVELPESIQQQCIAVAKAFMLEWTAIDWRLRLCGEYVFLEANPSPMFLGFEQKTGFSITQQLVKLLMDN